jgi:hypothetical protein
VDVEADNFYNATLMTTIRTLAILVLGLTNLLYSRAQSTGAKIAAKNTISKAASIRDTVIENTKNLLDKATTAGALEFTSGLGASACRSFLFFKSGHIISTREKNALVVVCPTDTTYAIRLYSIQPDKWNLIDSIGNLDAFPTQFALIFDDYNFDTQTDLYVQVTASNGWSLSRGHLIIIDPMTKRLRLHNETRDFANMTPDKKAKTVQTELWNGYDAEGRHQLTIFTNKWVDGQLKTISKKNISLKP